MKLGAKRVFDFVRTPASTRLPLLLRRTPPVSGAGGPLSIASRPDALPLFQHPPEIDSRRQQGSRLPCRSDHPLPIRTPEARTSGGFPRSASAARSIPRSRTPPIAWVRSRGRRPGSPPAAPRRSASSCDAPRPSALMNTSEQCRLCPPPLRRWRQMPGLLLHGLIRSAKNPSATAE